MDGCFRCSTNGRYNSYTNGIVRQAHILQAHLNRFGFASGKADGMLSPISDAVIKRMQLFLNVSPEDEREYVHY